MGTWRKSTGPGKDVRLTDMVMFEMHKMTVADLGFVSDGQG